MEAIVERCCGLDVHQGSIVACVLTGKADAKPEKQVRTFGTMTHELNGLRDWLAEHECTHVAMESTSVYWMPVYKVLEGHFELVVGNAQHLAKVPGRKTDVLDSEWLAELLRHGLIRKSFIPPPAIRELRDLTRYRRKLVESRSSERNRLQKLLETANIKLASVMSDVFGASGMAMLRALVDDESTPEEMAKLARGQLRKKLPLLELALDGVFEEHHRYLLQTQLERLKQLDRTIADVEKRIEAKLEPYREQYTRLMQIPGVSRVVASIIIAEMGVDMSVFKSADACASWAGVCPGNNESAGKRKRGRTRRGNSHLKTALVEAAQSASRKKGSYLRSKFHKLRARSDYQKAAMAIAHKIAISAYHMLAKGEDYRELGETYLDQKNQQRVADRLVKRLENLGYDVELKEREPVAMTELQVMRVSGLDDMSPSAEARSVAVDDPRTVSSTDVHSEPSPEVHDVDSDVMPPNAEGASGVCDCDGRAATVVETTVESTSHSSGSQGDAPPTRPATHGDATARARKRKTRRKHTPSAGRSRAGDLRDPRLPPAGTIMTRIFKDIEHQVRVLEDGFEYEGTVYPTISRVAKEITGTSRNGYEFFRLNPPRRKGGKLSDRAQSSE